MRSMRGKLTGASHEFPAFINPMSGDGHPHNHLSHRGLPGSSRGCVHGSREVSDGLA